MLIADLIRRYPHLAQVIRRAVTTGQGLAALPAMADVDATHLYMAVRDARALRLHRRAMRPTTARPTLDERAERLGFREWLSRGCHRGEDREATYYRGSPADVAWLAFRARRGGAPMPPAECLPAGF